MAKIGEGDFAGVLGRSLPEFAALVREHEASWDFPFTYMLLARLFGEVKYAVEMEGERGCEEARRVYAFIDEILVQAQATLETALVIEMLEPLVSDFSLDFALGPAAVSQLARLRQQP